MSTNITLYSGNSNLAKRINQALGNIADVSVLSEISDTKNSDVSLLDADTIGVSNLAKLKKYSFVIVLTEEKGARYLIESMTFGAFDCIIDPLDNSKLIESVK